MSRSSRSDDELFSVSLAALQALLAAPALGILDAGRRKPCPVLVEEGPKVRPAGQNGLGVPRFRGIGSGTAEFDGMGALGKAFDYGRRMEREPVLHGMEAGGVAGGADPGVAGRRHALCLRFGMRRLGMDCAGGRQKQGQGQDREGEGVQSLHGGLLQGKRGTGGQKAAYCRT